MALGAFQYAALQRSLVSTRVTDLRGDLQGAVRDLSVREFDLLHFLAANADQVLARQRILDEVWGYNFFGDENNVEVYIRYLRQKLGDTAHERIQTVRGVGYRLRSTVGSTQPAEA